VQAHETHHAWNAVGEKHLFAWLYPRVPSHVRLEHLSGCLSAASLLGLGSPGLEARYYSCKQARAVVLLSLWKGGSWVGPLGGVLAQWAEKCIIVYGKVRLTEAVDTPFRKMRRPEYLKLQEAWVAPAAKVAVYTCQGLLAYQGWSICLFGFTMCEWFGKTRNTPNDSIEHFPVWEGLWNPRTDVLQFGEWFVKIWIREWFEITRMLQPRCLCSRENMLSCAHIVFDIHTVQGKFRGVCDMFGLPGTTFWKLPVPRKPAWNVSG